MAFTLSQAQRLLLGIITSVEGGITSPEDASKELADLKTKAIAAGFEFKSTFTTEDFQRLRSSYISEYESSQEFEESYESSY